MPAPRAGEGPAKVVKLEPAKVETEEAALYRRGKEVLGGNAGGVITKLLAIKGKNVELARAKFAPGAHNRLASAALWLGK